MSVVVVPWKAGCAHRSAALGWITAHYLADGHQIHYSQPVEWNKPRAINEAAAKLDGIVIVSDAECWAEGIDEAIAAVEGGEPWAVPHTLIHRLTRDATDAVLAGAEPFDQETLEPPYKGTASGGVFVTTAELLRDVPWDERFIGWGREDCAWRDAVRTLHGMEWRGLARCVHLWHPPAPDARRISDTNEALYLRYRAARDSQERMRAVLP